MRSVAAAIARFVWAFGFAVCVAAAPSSAAGPEPRGPTVWVVSNAWHSAIVLDRRAAVATGLLPEAADFPQAAFLEVGWGDRVYYRARDPSFAMALGAGLSASPAIMHIASLARAPEPRPADSDGEVVALTLSPSGFLALLGALAGDLDRPEGGRAAPVSRGLYPDSYFYRAHGSFHLFNTCNTWTARMLESGGVKLSPSGVITADDLMSRLRTAL